MVSFRRNQRIQKYVNASCCALSSHEKKSRQHYASTRSAEVYDRLTMFFSSVTDDNGYLRQLVLRRRATRSSNHFANVMEHVNEDDSNEFTARLNRN